MPHDALRETLARPNPCAQPQAALKELRRRFTAIRRASQIGAQLPSLELLYRGARSIYAGAFEQDDFAPRLRFATEEQKRVFPADRPTKGYGLSTPSREVSLLP